MVLAATMDHTKERQPLLDPLSRKEERSVLIVRAPQYGNNIQEKSEQDGNNTAQKGRLNANMFVLLLMVLVVAAGSANAVARKIMTQSMGNYSLFLTLFSATAYFLMYHLLLFVKVMLGMVDRWCYAYPWIRNPKEYNPQGNIFVRIWTYLPPFKYFVIIGFLESWGNVLQIVATQYLSGPMVSLLGQTTIFFSMIVSYIMFKARFSLLQVFGVFLVVGGALVPLIHQFVHSAHHTAKAPFEYYIIMAISSLPMTISFAIKEMLFQRTKGLDIFVVNGTSSMFQLVWWPSVLPITVILHQTGGTPIFEYFRNALMCFVGRDPPDEFVFDCGPNPYPYLIYITINILFNIAIILLIKRATAVQSFMALNGVLPMSVVLFCINWPLLGSTPIDVFTIVSLVVVMAGLIFYRWATVTAEKKKKKEQLIGRNEVSYTENAHGSYSSFTS